MRHRSPALHGDFRFLGRTTECSEGLLLLFGGGRTLKVRGTGPVDDEYVVDAIQDGLLVLRFLPAGSTQVVQLVPGPQAAVQGWSAADSQQD